MRQEILKFLPELNDIENPDLREGTIKCFLLACEEGGKRPQDMTEMAFTALVETAGSTAKVKDR